MNWRSIAHIFLGSYLKVYGTSTNWCWCADSFLPIVAMALVALSAVTRVFALRPLLLFLGGCDLYVVCGMIPRQGHDPTPAIPMLLISLALLSFVCELWRTNLAKRLAITSAVFLGFGIIPAFIPGALESWESWPPYHPLVGFGDLNDNTLLNASLIETIAADVDRLAKPKEPIYVALDHNGGHFANAAALYWALDHPPASRYFELDPA